MMIARRPSRRSGFTLLEVLLASAIGVLLLGALYIAFDISLSRTDRMRDFVRTGDLARAIVNRMSYDIGASLAPLPPKSGGGNAQSSTTSSSSTTSTTSTTSSTTTTTDTSSTDTTSTDGSAALPTPTEGTQAADVPFQGGVFGSVDQLTMYISRVPPDLLNPETAILAETGAIDPRSDMRRVTYYLGSGGGLCRQEQYLVTADGVRNSIDPDLSRESLDLIAAEVTELSFDYFNGTTWVSEWSGDDSAEDGLSVIGPPRAIRMTMTVQRAGGKPKQIQHVFPIRAAPGLYTPPTSTTTTDDTTTSTTTADM